MTPRTRFSPMLIAVLIAPLLGAAPANPPADDSTAVKSTLKAFYAATAGGDREAILKRMHMSDASQKAMAEMFADMVSLHVRLRNAIPKKFGADALADMPDPSAPTAAEID